MSKIRKRPLAAFAIAAATLAPTAALAHPYHAREITEGLLGGLLHPVTGLDHLTTLLLAGAWAAVVGGRALLQIPAFLLLAMVAGFVAAPLVGSGIAETLAAFATVSLMVLAASRYRAPVPVAVIACTVFGFGHGLPHGLESTGSGVAFATGMVVSSLLLLSLGIAGANRALRATALDDAALHARL